MRYPHAVKFNGVWYEAGKDVPNGNSTAEKVVEKATVPIEEKTLKKKKTEA